MPKRDLKLCASVAIVWGLLYSCWIIKVSADSGVEKSQHSQIVALESNLRLANAQVTALTKANLELKQRISDAKLSATGTVATMSAQIARNSATAASQAKTHDEEHGAVVQAQEESTQTLTNTDASIRAQAEFEKQNLALARDLHAVIKTQSREMILLLVLTCIVLAFTGVIWIAYRKSSPAPPVPCPEPDKKGA